MKPILSKLILTLSLVTLLSACAGRHVHQTETYDGRTYTNETSVSLKTYKNPDGEETHKRSRPHHHHHGDDHSHAGDIFAYIVFRVVVENIIYHLINH